MYSESSFRCSLGRPQGDTIKTHSYKKEKEKKCSIRKRELYKMTKGDMVHLRGCECVLGISSESLPGWNELAGAGGERSNTSNSLGNEAVSLVVAG